MADTNAQQFLLIQQHLGEGRTGEALAELRVLLSRQSDHGKAQALYGRILMEHLLDYLAAEEAFRLAMRQAPAYPDLYYDYGDLLLRLDKGTETVAVLNKALEVPGIEKDRIYHLFGNLYERQAKWEDALDYYTKAILYSLSDEAIRRYTAAIERVKQKSSLL
ncbi:MAG: hypothetical protein JNL88_01915 [Bacteroidia bacterium]|nr:hypothetical protein [Bacteroidia bacterium]